METKEFDQNMKSRITALVLAVSLGATPALAIPGFGSTKVKGVGATAAHPHPGANFRGQTYVTPGGCSYTRAQVPGYKPTWHLIVNGASFGMTNSRRGCPAMLGDYEPG